MNKQKFKADYDAALEEFDAWVREPIDHTEPVSKSFTDWYEQVARTTSASTGPAFIAFFYRGVEGVKRVINSEDPEQVRLANALRRGYPDNQVVQMGIMLYDLAQMLPKEMFRDLDTLLAKMGTGLRRTSSYRSGTSSSISSAVAGPWRWNSRTPAMRKHRCRL